MELNKVIKSYSIISKYDQTKSLPVYPREFAQIVKWLKELKNYRMNDPKKAKLKLDNGKYIRVGYKVKLVSPKNVVSYGKVDEINGRIIVIYWGAAQTESILIENNYLLDGRKGWKLSVRDNKDKIIIKNWWWEFHPKGIDY